MGGAPSGRRGRQQAYSDAAIQACLTLKVLFGLPLRQTTGFAASLLECNGLDWSVPDYSTLCRRQRTLLIAIPYKGSAGPLHLLIDSTGIKVEGEGEWNARKHGGPKRRLWRKIHIGVDEQTLEIRGPSRLRAAALVMRPCCLTYSPRPRQIKSSAASLRTVLTIHENATMQSRSVMRMPSYLRVRTPGCGNLTRPVPDPQRSRPVVKVSGQSLVAEPDRLPPPQPRRDKDALCETSRSTPLGARLRPSGCGDPNPGSHPKRLHSDWHTTYRRCRLNPFGVRGSLTAGLFVQQSLAGQEQKQEGEQK